MAVDKLVDSAQLDADLTSVANAIRTKGGTSGQLAFPSGFVSAIGDIPTGGGSTTLKMGVLRPDAVLEKSFTFDKYVHADLEITIPSYSTSTTTLIASGALSPTVTLDYANYNWYVLERMLTIPEYSVTTKAKGRVEYHAASYMYEICEVPANTYAALLNGTKYASRTVSIPAAGTMVRLVYWSSGTAVTVYSTSGYGTYQVVAAPTISSGVLTLNSPTMGLRGHTTYFVNTYYNALTDIRVQYVIEVWKAPKSNLNLDGWGTAQQMIHVASCADGDTNKLT